MEEDIDIRNQVLTVLRSWKMILALAVLAAAAAGAYAWSLPNTYEAEALVSLAPGRVFLDLDGVSQTGSIPVAAYVELAESSPVAQAILDAAEPNSLGTLQSLGRLRRRLSAEASPSAPLLRLQVTDSDPERAAHISNLWAETFTKLAGQLYGQDQANLLLYNEALADAQTDLEAAAAALADFQSSNRVGILQAQLGSAQASLSDYLKRDREAALLRQDVQSLLSRLNGLQGNAAASLADDLALLALTNRVFGGQLTGGVGALEANNPLVIQISGDAPLTNGTVADQRQLAEDLLASLEARQAALIDAVANVEPEILALQGQVAEAQMEEQRLAGARFVAEELYGTRVIQVKEADLAVRQSTNVAQVASPASVPLFSTGPSRLVYVLLGAGLGAALGVVLALAREFLRPAVAQPASAPPAAPAPARTPSRGEMR